MKHCPRKTLTFPDLKSCMISTASRLISSKYYSPSACPYLPLPCPTFTPTQHLWGRIAYLLSDTIHSLMKDTVCKWKVPALCNNSKFTAMSFNFYFFFSGYQFPLYPVVISLLRTIYWISFVLLISVKFQTPYKCMWLLNHGKKVEFFGFYLCLVVFLLFWQMDESSKMFQWFHLISVNNSVAFWYKVIIPFHMGNPHFE